MEQATSEVAAEDAGTLQVPNPAPPAKNITPIFAPQGNTAPLPEASTTFADTTLVAPSDATPAPTNIVPTPQGEVSTTHANVTPTSRSVDSFSASIYELFNDVWGGISDDVTGPP
ncbi:unnamed protein product [Ilex paraguariensis]|uniref:Uncharacterized protein n=1 Tax=Ilex paraguariensis TaxID=185542 RepID=A0ABC8SQH7_9AQUA